MYTFIFYSIDLNNIILIILNFAELTELIDSTNP